MCCVFRNIDVRLRPPAACEGVKPLRCPVPSDPCCSKRMVDMTLVSYECIAFTDDGFSRVQSPQANTRIFHRFHPLRVVEDLGHRPGQSRAGEVRLGQDHRSACSFQDLGILHLMIINCGRQRNENGRLAASCQLRHCHGAGTRYNDIRGVDGRWHVIHKRQDSGRDAGPPIGLTHPIMVRLARLMRDGHVRPLFEKIRKPLDCRTVEGFGALTPAKDQYVMTASLALYSRRTTLSEKLFPDRCPYDTSFALIEEARRRFKREKHALNEWAYRFIGQTRIRIWLHNHPGDALQCGCQYHHRTGIPSDPDDETRLSLAQDPTALPETERHGAQPLQHVSESFAHHRLRIN